MARRTATRPLSVAPRLSPTADQAWSDVFLPFTFVVHVLVFAVLAWALIPSEHSTSHQMRLYTAYCVLAPVATLGLRFLLPLTRIGRRTVADHGRAIQLVGLVVGFAVILWGLRGVDVTLYHGAEVPRSPLRFAAGIAIGAGLVVAVAVAAGSRLAPWFRSGRAVAVAGALAAVVAISLFDVYLVFDTLSYAPYLGPAEIVAGGGLPLVDGFSQYGPNFVVFTWLFAILPRSLFTAAALVTAFNVAFYLTFLAIVARLVRQKAIMLLVATWVLLFLHAAYLYNVTRTPSVLAMRFLPPTLVLLAACSLGPVRSFSVASVATLVVTSLWSVEALLFGGLVYAAFLFVDGVSQRVSPLRMVGRFAAVAAALGAPHLILSASYLVALGLLPRYDVYLELVRGGSALAAWTAVANPNVRTWALFGLTYAVGLTYALHAAAVPSDATSVGGRRAALLAGICTLGIVTFSYYVGRSVTPLLVFLAWPLAVVVLVALDSALASSRGERTLAHWGTIVVACVALPLMAGVFVDRFGRPLDTSDPMQPVMQSNSTALYALVNDPSAVLPSVIWSRMRTTDPFPPRAGTPSHPYWQAEVAYPMFERWRAATGADPLVVLPEAFTVLFFADTTSRIGLAHPVVDGLSPTLSQRALDRLDTVSTGDVVIVGNPKAWTEEVPLDDIVMRLLRARCTLHELERRTNEVMDPPPSDRLTVVAFRLECS